MPTGAVTTERQDIHQIIDTLSDAAIEKLAHYIAFLRFEDGNSDGFYNPANINRLQHSIEQMEKGRFVVKTMEELDHMADE
jgi:cytochrome c553